MNEWMNEWMNSVWQTGRNLALCFLESPPVPLLLGGPARICLPNFAPSHLPANCLPSSKVQTTTPFLFSSRWHIIPNCPICPQVPYWGLISCMYIHNKLGYLLLFSQSHDNLIRPAKRIMKEQGKNSLSPTEYFETTEGLWKFQWKILENKGNILKFT